MKMKDVRWKTMKHLYFMARNDKYKILTVCIALDITKRNATSYTAINGPICMLSLEREEVSHVDAMLQSFEDYR